MKTSGLVERYAEQIDGVLGCFDRVVETGTLREVSHPDALAGRLRHEGIRCFDLGQFADPLRQKVCDHAKAVAREAGVEIQFLARSKGVRKEELVGAVLARRGHRICLARAFFEKPGTCHDHLAIIRRRNAWFPCPGTLDKIRQGRPGVPG